MNSTNTVTKETRQAVRQLLEESGEWHAASMRINRDGIVSARKDADKTFNGPHTEYFVVGHWRDLLDRAAEEVAQ